MRIILVVFAVLSGVAGAQAQDSAIGGPDAIARFDAERLDYLMEQAMSGARMQPQILPEGADASARTLAARATRRALYRFMILREEACARGAIDEEACTAFEPPDWAGEAIGEVPSAAAISARLDWLREQADAFIEAGCAAGDAAVGEEELVFCTARLLEP